MGLSLVIPHDRCDVLRNQLLGVLYYYHDEAGVVGVILVLLIVLTVLHDYCLAQLVYAGRPQKGASLLECPRVVVLWGTGHDQRPQTSFYLEQLSEVGSDIHAVNTLLQLLHRCELPLFGFLIDDSCVLSILIVCHAPLSSYLFD
jgi:hypothetical protein